MNSFMMIKEIVKIALLNHQNIDQCCKIHVIEVLSNSLRLVVGTCQSYMVELSSLLDNSLISP